jgi:hypothetical protein
MVYCQGYVCTFAEEMSSPSWHWAYVIFVFARNHSIDPGVLN